MSVAREKLGVMERVGTVQTGFEEMVIFYNLVDILILKIDPIDLSKTNDVKALAVAITQWLVLGDQETYQSQFLVKAGTIEDDLIKLLQAVRDCHNKYDQLFRVPELVLEDCESVEGARKLVVKRNNQET